MASARIRTAPTACCRPEGESGLSPSLLLGFLAPQLRERTFERATGSARFARCAVGDSIRRHADVLLVGSSVGRVPVIPVPAPLGGIAPGTGGTRGFGGSLHKCQFAQAVRSPAWRVRPLFCGGRVEFWPPRLTRSA